MTTDGSQAAPFPEFLPRMEVLPPADRVLIAPDIATLAKMSRIWTLAPPREDGWEDVYCDTAQLAWGAASLGITSARGAFGDPPVAGASGRQANGKYAPEITLSLPGLFLRQRLRMVRRVVCVRGERGDKQSKYQYAVLLKTKDGLRAVPIGFVDAIAYGGRTSAYIMWKEFVGDNEQLCGVALEGSPLSGYQVTSRGFMCFVEDHVQPGLFVPRRSIQVSRDIDTGIKVVGVWVGDGPPVRLLEGRMLLVELHHMVLLGRPITEIPFKDGVRRI